MLLFVLGYLDKESTCRNETTCYEYLCGCYIRLLSFFALVRTEARYAASLSLNWACDT